MTRPDCRCRPRGPGAGTDNPRYSRCCRVLVDQLSETGQCLLDILLALRTQFVVDLLDRLAVAVLGTCVRDSQQLLSHLVSAPLQVGAEVTPTGATVVTVERLQL